MCQPELLCSHSRILCSCWLFLCFIRFLFLDFTLISSIAIILCTIDGSALVALAFPCGISFRWTRSRRHHRSLTLDFVVGLVHSMEEKTQFQRRQWSESERQSDFSATENFLHQIVTLTNLIVTGPTFPHEDIWSAQATTQWNRTMRALRYFALAMPNSISLIRMFNMMRFLETAW